MAVELIYIFLVQFPSDIDQMITMKQFPVTVTKKSDKYSILIVQFIPDQILSSDEYLHVHVYLPNLLDIDNEVFYEHDIHEHFVDFVLI